MHAQHGKRARALPVALLYEQGKVSHAGLMATLEDQMCRFGAEGFAGSPDRVDTLVWAVWALMLDRMEGPRVRALCAGRAGLARGAGLGLISQAGQRRFAGSNGRDR